jgi:hypothetical protein
MAKFRRQPRLRCQIHFLPDRHVVQKMSQVYHWLVPESEPEISQRSSQLSIGQHAKDSRHLRPSFL